MDQTLVWVVGGAALVLIIVVVVFGWGGSRWRDRSYVEHGGEAGPVPARRQAASDWSDGGDGGDGGGGD